MVATTFKASPHPSKSSHKQSKERTGADSEEGFLFLEVPCNVWRARSGLSYLDKYVVSAGLAVGFVYVNNVIVMNMGKWADME